MKLPALKNAMPATLIDGQSIDEFIRNSTKNLQRMQASMPGGGDSNVQYLDFDGLSGDWKLNKEPVDPKSIGRILVPRQALFEGCIEWANNSPLQKIRRQLLGVPYDEPMSERLFTKPLSPGAYKKDSDGPTLVYGFIGILLDDGGNVVFEKNSMGASKAVNNLATTTTQAVAAFGEFVHPVIELGSESYEGAHRTIYNPLLSIVGYVTDARANEVDVISADDIITRPTPSQAKLRRAESEAPAL